jgi:PadR family transcriptional regulator, regulatory protein PadR
MEPLQRVTAPTCEVLQVLLDAGEPLWGLKIMSASGRPSGTIYPILDRLERQGWVRSEWEADDARPGPRRRLYELTAEGAPAAEELLRARAESPPAPRPSRARTA